jgi:hypothetical protein
MRLVAKRQAYDDPQAMRDITPLPIDSADHA